MGIFRVRLIDLGLVGVFSFALMCSFTSLWLPFGWDHGMMAAVGAKMAGGGVPFQDAWDLKGPLAYIPFALSSLLFGHVMWGVRLFEILILIPALYILYRFVEERTSSAIGMATALALYLWFASAGFFFTAQPEIWATALITIAMCILLRRRPKGSSEPALFLLIGALISLAALVKPHFLGFVLVPLAFLVWAPNMQLVERARLGAVGLAGAAVPIVIVLAFMASRGALWDLIETQFLFTLMTYGPGSDLSLGSRYVFHGTLAFFFQGTLTLLIPFAVAGLWSVRHEVSLAGPLLVWLLFALLAVLIQGKLFTYHWFLLYPPLLICAALGAHGLTKDLSRKPLANVLVCVAAVMFIGQVALSPARDMVKLGGALFSKNFEEAFYGSFRMHAYEVTDVVRAATYLRMRTRSDDGIFVWGNDATVGYLANRPAPTRFTHILPLSANGPLRAPYRQEMMRGLTATPPAYIAIGSPWYPGLKEEALKDFPEFAAFVTGQYELETAIGNVNLYHRKDHNMASAGSIRQ